MYLQELKGLYRCNQAKTDRISFSQFEELIEKDARALGNPSIPVSTLKAKIIEFLNSEKEIKSLDIRKRFTNESGRSATRVEFVNEINSKNIEFFSDQEYLTLSCTLKIFFHENLILIGISLCLGVYLYFKVPFAGLIYAHRPLI